VADLAWSDGTLEAGLGSRAAAGMCTWPASVARMVDVERALVRALARAGVVADATAAAAASACDVQRLELTELARDAADAGTAVIPLVQQLRAGLAPDVAAAIHHGATSQDVVDSANVVMVRAVLDLLERELLGLGAALAARADEERDTRMVGRTLLQRAEPVTFGLKAARWLAAVTRRIDVLRQLRPRVLVVQLGGAVGTLAAYGDAGPAVAAAFAGELGLGTPDVPWHGERDRLHDLCGASSAIAAVTAKIAGDLLLLAQTEVGEAVPGDRAGGSSAMAHKRNPTDAVAAVAASRLAIAASTALVGGDHAHERAAGAWQVEWVALPRMLVHVVGAVERTRLAVDDVVVDHDRIAANLAAGWPEMEPRGPVGSSAAFIDAVRTGFAATAGAAPPPEDPRKAAQ
jgi:3-carboxy-cis,cis-muconate cycloisomerase